jgi:hypothetical protein
MLHDAAQDGRLQVLPFAIRLGDGDEVVAEENARDAGYGKQPLGQGPSGMTTRPGRNFRVAGLGVASV